MLNQVTKLNNGRIVLINGDCLTWLPQIRSKANMIFADLPYGTTQNKWDSVIPLKQLWEHLKCVSVSNAAYVYTAQIPFSITLGASNLSMLKYEWIWQKERGTGHLNSKRQPQKDHENILVFYDQQCTYNPQMIPGIPYIRAKKRDRQSSNNYGSDSIDNILTISDGARYPKTVIQFARSASRLHPTQKPVELLEYLIKTYTNENDLVIDPTMGVGTTGVACAKLNRRFIGIELDTTEGYYEIALDRIQEVLDANPT